MLMIAETYTQKPCWGCAGGEDTPPEGCPVCNGTETIDTVLRVYEDGSTQEVCNGIEYLRQCRDGHAIPTAYTGTCPVCESNEMAQRALS